MVNTISREAENTGSIIGCGGLRLKPPIRAVRGTVFGARSETLPRMKLAARLPFAIVLASALAFVLATRGFDSFEGVRSKVVNGTMPAAAGAVRLTVDGRGTVARLHPPFALIAHLGNDTSTP